MSDPNAPELHATGAPRLRDGYTDVPAGRIATIATTLEMRTPPQPSGGDDPRPPPLILRRVDRPDLAWYRDLYRRVGEPWLWFSRLRLSDAVLARIVHDPAVVVWAAATTGDVGERDDVGLVELDFRVPGECELAYFGLTLPWTGRGAGPLLMRHAIAEAWARPIQRFWVHTCTLDHPAALQFYIRSGFTPIKRQLEIALDPRLDGTLPPDAAPHVPLLR